MMRRVGETMRRADYTLARMSGMLDLSRDEKAKMSDGADRDYGHVLRERSCAFDEKIGAVGFSAGAHLAAISATSSQDALYERIDALDDISAHLNFSIPVYPAYVVDDGRTGPNAHGGDGAAILPEFKFDAKTPPMFMLHGDKDYYSPMASVLIYTELHKRRSEEHTSELQSRI